MGPLVDAALEKADMKHAQLTQLSTNLVDAFNLYHSLMREPYHYSSTPHLPANMPTHQVIHFVVYFLLFVQIVFILFAMDIIVMYFIELWDAALYFSFNC